VKASGAIVFWTAAIAALLFVEVAELTHLFTLPFDSVIGNLVSFIFALVFTTILALVGALFLGIYISQRLQSPGGFTPFEEEMLRMRSDVTRLTDEVSELRRKLGANGGSGPSEPAVPSRDPSGTGSAPPSGGTP
jgi:hypothetical protein